MSNETEYQELTKPKVIGNLIGVGNAVFWLSAISGAIVLFMSLQCVDYCGRSYATYAYEEEPMMVVLGIALFIGGWVQQQFIHGFSVGLDQLFEIRKNTTK